MSFVTNEKISDVRKYPCSYYWQLVNQGINKGNLLSGGGFEFLTPENAKKQLAETMKRKIKEYREKENAKK